MLICLLIMLPRLLSPNFGLMDDGRSLSVAEGLMHGKFDLSWDVVAGRARPVYWLAFAFWYFIAGGHSFWYFIGNLIVFSASTFLLIRLVVDLGGSKIQALLTGLVFVLSTSLIENIYTLSKAENFQVFLLLAAISLAILAARSTRRTGRGWLVVASTLLLLIACFTKESTVLVLPISLVWWAIAWLGIWRRYSSARFVEQVSRYLVIASVLSGVIFYIGRVIILSSSKILGVGQSSGFSFTASNILDGVIRWGGWLLRDYFWLLPMVLVVLVWCIIRRRWPHSGLWWLALVWMAFWLGMYIPWRFGVEYYLMPFAAGSAILSGCLLAEIIEMARQERVIWRGVGIAALAVTAGLLLVSQANSYTDATVQVTQDAANMQLLDYVAKNAPQGSRVVVNLQLANEYIEEMQLYLADYFNRPDLTLVIYQGEELSNLEAAYPGMLFIVAELVNQPKMTVRMGLDEPSLQVWNAGVSQQLASWHAVFQVRRDPAIMTVNFPRLLCPLLKAGEYCSAGGKLVDSSQLQYQWSVYTP